MNQKSNENEKRTLLNDLINVTREIASKYNNEKQVMTESQPEVEKLLHLLEKVVCFGLKNSSLFELFTSSVTFWTFAQHHLTKHEQERFSSYKNVSQEN